MIVCLRIVGVSLESGTVTVMLPRETRASFPLISVTSPTVFPPSSVTPVPMVIASLDTLLFFCSRFSFGCTLCSSEVRLLSSFCRAFFVRSLSAFEVLMSRIVFSTAALADETMSRAS